MQNGKNPDMSQVIFSPERGKDKYETWVPLKVKESHPRETAKFAKMQDIADAHAFAWWVSHSLQKCNIILSSKVKAWIRKTTQKYGIEISTSVKHTLDLDNKNSNNF